MVLINLAGVIQLRFAFQNRVEPLPKHARVGPFNTRIDQHFMRQDVVNLDGVVNPDVLAYKTSGRMCDYLAARGINHLVDTSCFLDKARQQDQSLQFSRTIDLSHRYDASGAKVVQRQILVTLDLSRCERRP